MVKLKEANGIQFDDITPSGSENDAGNTSESEEYEGESSESNGADQGFGPQYTIPPSGK